MKQLIIIWIKPASKNLNYWICLPFDWIQCLSEEHAIDDAAAFLDCPHFIMHRVEGVSISQQYSLPLNVIDRICSMLTGFFIICWICFILLAYSSLERLLPKPSQFLLDAYISVLQPTTITRMAISLWAMLKINAVEIVNKWTRL